MALHVIKVTTTGSAGSATGDSTTGFDLDNELIGAIKIDYHASAPATTDVTIEETEGLQRAILTISDNATDGTYYPRHGTHDNTGSSSGGTEFFIVAGPVKVSVAQSDALTDVVTVYIQTIYNQAVN